MPRDPIFLNQTNHIAGTHRFVYKFPNQRIFKRGDSLSLMSVNIYNQTFNIAPKYNNDKFSIIWINGTTYNFTIPPGYYSASDLNTYVEYVCLLNNLYVSVSNQTAPVYFISIKANVIQYKGQIDVVAVPTASEATNFKYTKPSGATWNYPNTPRTPQIVLSPGLGKILGFKANLTLPPTPVGSTISFFSDVTPVISPVDTYVIGCNLINSNSSPYPEVMGQISLHDVGLGEQINYSSGVLAQLNISPGSYNEFRIEFFDQNMQPIDIIDPSCAIYLVIDYDS